MIAALAYLRLTSLGNRVASAVRRLREPKYLAGALAGVAYFYFFLFRPMGVARGPLLLGDPAGALRQSGAALAAAGSAILLGLFLGRQALAWITPADNPGLRFCEAEIAFLFPAPLTRRRLVHFNLLSAQATILLSSLILTVLSQRWRLLGGSPVARAVGWWVILSTLSLHSTAVGLVVARRSGPGFARVRAAALATIALLGAAVAWSVWRRAGTLEPMGPNPGLGALVAWVTELLDSGVLHWILWPFRWTVAPFLSADLRSFLLALGPALALPAALYAWIVRTEAPFEEGSIALSEKRAAARAARSSGSDYAASGPTRPRARREPFRLAGTGRPELAFLWKNLIAIQSWFNLRVVAAAVAMVAIVGAADLRPAAGSGRWEVIAAAVAVGSGIVAFYTVLIGPQLLRQDIRHDLQNADILKTYPLAGWQVILGEMLTPVAILSGILWLCLLCAAWAATRLGGPDFLGGAARPVVIVAAAAVVPPLSALQLVIPNAAALVFPAWFQAARTRGGSIELIGQRLIFAAGQWLAIALAVLPALILAPSFFVATQFWVGLFAPDPVAVAAAAVAGAAAALVILCGEVWVGVWWLGLRFEKLDLTSASR